MKKKIIALAGVALLTGILIMTGLILNGQSNANPFDYRADTNLEKLF